MPMEFTSKLMRSLDPNQLKQATDILEKMRAEYPSYRDDELLLYCLTQALTDVKDRRPLP